MKHIVMAIEFGDNDFYNTYTNLLRAIGSNPSREGPWWDNKEKSFDIINEVAYSFYLLTQNPYAYNGHEKNSTEYIRHMKSYLKFDLKRFHFGEDEVDKFLQENYWCNGEVFILDTRLPKDEMVFSR